MSAKNIQDENILILDFGSQYTRLIARRIREAGVYCEIHPWNTAEETFDRLNPRAFVLSGSPRNVSDKIPRKVHERVFASGKPVLGICYGMQIMAKQLGGEIISSGKGEFGHAKVKVEAKSRLVKGDVLPVWMSHADRVERLPEGFARLASSEHSPIAAMQNEQKGFYGLQFHPEVTHTPDGAEILRRFACEIAGCSGQWTPENIIEAAVAKIQRRVGGEKVLLAISGGVDSSVAAALLHRAIGDQLVCLFVDNGLLRLGEAGQVMQTFAEKMEINVVKVDAAKQFYAALKGVADPEEKRKVIGKKFIEIFEKKSKKLGNIPYLAQGTIYPDVIESAGDGGGAHVIKSHHNVGGLPEKMNMKLVEPLRELFKDEVRHLGERLGLDKGLLYRHPFPGPGLGVRHLGEINPDNLSLLRKADAIFIEELISQNLYHKLSQAFAVFLPVHSVGVTGDARHYAPVVALRAVETQDFMTATWARLPDEFLARTAERILNEVKGISRVVYDISAKPPATIEWE